MDKRIMGLLASAALMLSGASAFAEERTFHPDNSLADWAATEGYGWTKVDGNTVFCRPEVTIGTHIRKTECLNYQRLVARWEEWKRPLLRKPPYQNMSVPK
jgi:hypothetical protein